MERRPAVRKRPKSRSSAKGTTSSAKAKTSPAKGKTGDEVLISNELLETLPDAIVAVDADGVIVQTNSQAQELFGYEREELIGQKVEMLVPESYRRQHHHHRESF